MSLVNQEKPRNGHGGARPNSGRKRLPIEMVWKDFAHEALTAVDSRKLIVRLLHDENPYVRLETFRYLLDRILGKPAQAVSISGDAEQPLKVIFQVVGGTKDSEERVRRAIER